MDRRMAAPAGGKPEGLQVTIRPGMIRGERTGSWAQLVHC